VTARMDFQRLVLSLTEFWGRRGCLLSQPYDLEMGAGTMHPETFFRVLGPEPWNVAYVQPSRRPTDGRYGENPFRLGRYFQYQVILKPSPDDVQEVYLESLAAFGIDPALHDIRFEEDNWESPTLGASGVGWQVTCDGMEITQFTYFQQCGGQELPVVSAEITYGIERIGMFLNDVGNVFDLAWREDEPRLTYGDVRRQEEREFSRYHFETADVPMHLTLFETYRREGERLAELGLTLPAFDCCLRCSHLFNILDARGAVSVTERAAYVAKVRRLAVQCARGWLASREEQGFPLLRETPAGAPP
jgi:glycyl-tRNA synthetase alpha chain